MSQITNKNSAITPGTGPVFFLQGNSGGQVPPDGTGTIHTIVDTSQGTARVTGDAGTFTTSISFTDANDNTGVGLMSLDALTIGERNTAIGSITAPINTDGNDNIFVGANVAPLFDGGNENVIVGPGSAQNLVDGDRNILIGPLAGNGLLATESDNIYIGAIGFAGEDHILEIGRYATVPGAYEQNKCFIAAAYSNLGTSNTFVGESATLITPSTGSLNSSLGTDALRNIDTGSNNIAIGAATLTSLTSGSNNVAAGAPALNQLISGDNNICIGDLSGSVYTTNESDNIIIGNNGVIADSATIRIGTTGTHTSNYQAGIAGVTVSNTNMVTIDTTTGQLGSQAISSGGIQTITGNTGGPESPSAGNFNIVTANATAVFAGTAATETLDFGISNLLLGSAGASITTGVDNTALGDRALNAVTSGEDNVAVGVDALTVLTDGLRNTAVGWAAGNSISSGDDNVVIGYNAGDALTTGSGNIVIGSGANSTLSTASNTIAIGTGTVSSANSSIAIGNGATNNTAGRTQIGANGTQTTCFIAGIDGVNVGSVAKVVTMASDQLGTATITAGANITITPGANTITIASTGGGSSFTWSVITADQTAAVNNGYICNKGSTLALALPATSVVGDMIRVTGVNNATGWQVTQASGQQIFFGTASTTLGATGTLTSSATRDAIEMVCIATDTTWQVISSIGNITVV